jgi:DNA-binding CsgD family transcriptional regulator
MLAAEAGEANEPHLRIPRVVVESEILLEEKRFDQAIALVIDALRDLEPSEDAMLLTDLCRLGLRIAADRAAQPSRRAAAADDDLVWIASHIPPFSSIEEMGNRPALAASIVTAKAEESRARHTDNWKTWGRAADHWRSACQPWELAYCRLREAEQAARHRLAVRAADALNETAQLASNIKAKPLLAAAEALARSARMRIEVGSPAQPVPAGTPFGLTSREQEVLKELTTGASNREIAADLYISERTAAVHVSSILRKLGVRTRLEAGLLAQDLFRLQTTTNPPTNVLD